MSNRSGKWLASPGLRAAFGLCLLSLAAPLVGCDTRAANDRKLLRSLSVYPRPLILGDLRADEHASGLLNLRNHESSSVKIDSATSSCDCVTVSPMSLVVHPNETANLLVSYDPEASSTLRGELQVDLEGFDSSGARLFLTQIELRIR